MSYEFAAAHAHIRSRCAVGISARVLLVVPVPVHVSVDLLAPLVCDGTNRAENTSPVYTDPSKNIRQTEPRTYEPTNEIPFSI
jgi:hypothetical protein